MKASGQLGPCTAKANHLSKSLQLDTYIILYMCKATVLAIRQSMASQVVYSDTSDTSSKVALDNHVQYYASNEVILQMRVNTFLLLEHQLGQNNNIPH